MPDSILARVQRVVSAGLESAVDAAERASSSSLMRESVRQVERAIDEVEAARSRAEARKLQAARQEKQCVKQAATLGEQACFAISRDREDLAEAAINRQIDGEQQIQRLRSAQSEAAGEERALAEDLRVLRARKDSMEKELASFEAARRAAGADAKASPAGSPVGRKVERAEAAFDRAMKAAGGVPGERPGSGAAAHIVEIDALQRQEAVASRLAALRTAPQQKASRAKPGKRTSGSKRA